MLTRKKDQILAIKTQDKRYVGFHCENLEVASLDQDAWSAMASTHQTAPPKTVEALSEINAWNQSRNPQTLDVEETDFVQSLSINVTQLCNLSCSYCAAGGDGTYKDPVARIDVEKTLPQIKYFLNQVKKDHVFHINFLGGEPLLYPDAISAIHRYTQLASAGQGITLRYSITTNGTLLNDKNIALLKTLKAHVQVSLDGPPEINDPQRHSKGSSKINTHTVVDGLKKLVQQRKHLGGIGINAVFDNNNMNVLECYKFLDSLQSDWVELTYSVNETSPELSKKFSQQMQEVAAHAYEKYGFSGLRKIKSFDTIINNLERRVRIKNYCGAGKSHLMIDARNQIFSCPWDINDKSEKIGHSTQINEQKKEFYKKPFIEKPPCKTCWARFLCGGGCLFVHKVATGSKNNVNLDFCQRTKDLISTAIVYYEKELGEKELGGQI